jgi:ribosomal-protein-alanine N-acetyltransferase
MGPDRCALPLVMESERVSLTLLGPAHADDIEAGRRHPDWHDQFPREDDREAASMVDAFGNDVTWGPRRIRRRDDGLVVGTIGFVRPPDHAARVPRVEVGYGLVAAARGAGLATDALQMLIAATGRCGVQVSARVAPDNDPSTRVLERCGFDRVGAIGDGDWFYVHPAPNGS